MSQSLLHNIAGGILLSGRHVRFPAIDCCGSDHADCGGTLQKNRRLSTALNNMSQGLNMFDAHGRIILLNKALPGDVQAFTRRR
jgi:PAS domain-containing protein